VVGYAAPTQLVLARLLTSDDPAERTGIDVAARAAETRHLDPGEVVEGAGRPGDGIMFVLHGRLAVRVRDEVVEHLEPGRSVVGRPPLGAALADDPVALVAVEPTTVLVVPADAVTALRRDAPRAWRRLHDHVGRLVPSVLFTDTALFDGLDPELLIGCDDESGWVRLEAGDVLVEPGARCEALHVLVHGRIQAEAEGDEATVASSAGDVIGVVPFLLDEPHGARLRATRDSHLARLPRDDFERILEQAPHVSVRVARELATRLREQSAPGVAAPPGVRTVAVVQTGGPPGFARRLVGALGATGVAAELVSSGRVERQLGANVLAAAPGSWQHDRLVAWMHQLEHRHPLVVHDCDREPTLWTACALRQADLVLIVSPATARPNPHPLEAVVAEHVSFGRVELVLLHDAGRRPSGTAAWLTPRTVAAHHPVRADVPGDLARVARAVAGRSVGLALSGGGARGFAHIGALRALGEAGIAVDHVGGTSMGAVIAAEAALGFGDEEMRERNREEFARAMTLTDLTMPVLSLVRGGSTVRLLENLFGDARIEDLPIPYFCVSSNLTTATQVVHDRGPLWLWIRASSSVPGIGPPVPFGGELLVDGGLLNNLPADVMRRRCRGTVVAVDVTGKGAIRTGAPDGEAVVSGWRLLGQRMTARGRPAVSPHVMQVLTRATMLSSAGHAALTHASADLSVTPDVDDIQPFDWELVDRAADAGYAATRDLLVARDLGAALLPS
jgi:predicted acylesterase/phospholipase RssA/CRP-like cAMP-binding protein